MKNNMFTVENARKNGFKVRVMHFRPVVGENELFHTSVIKEKKLNLVQNGGLTRVEVTTPENKNFFGEASCHVNDCFNRRLGTRIALGRAFKLATEDYGMGS